MHPLPRRRRLLRRTLVAAALFLTLAALALWLVLRPPQSYRPGEGVEGLTAELLRDLPPDYPRVTFADVTQASGVAFQHFSGVRSSQLPEDMGSGAAWGDFDNDGWVDLFVVNSVGPIALSADDRARSPAHSTLYRNNGDGTFSDVTEEMGIEHRTWGMGAAWGDYDNDGWIDLVVTAYGEIVLFRNEEGRSFTDVGARTTVGGHPGFWAGATWGDYDRDGFLDLYVVGYVRFTLRPPDAVSLHNEIEEPTSLNPSSFPPERNLLFHNNGNGTFTELAARLGVADTTGRGMVAAWADLDDDGWPDLYVANDVSDNALFLNRGDGRFLNVSHAARVADYRGAMGLAIGDWDGDLDQDMMVTHWIAQENALYDNLLTQLRRADPNTRAPLQFMDEADRFGLGQIALDYIGWGTSFVDYDNDGRLDLFVVNGSTLQDRNEPSRLIPMQDQLFWNRGADQGFFDVSIVSGEYFAQHDVGRGAAFADFDNDGDIDAFVVNNGGRAALLRNEGGNAKAWLQVALTGTRSNRQGLGARLRVVAGGETQIREVGVQSSYLSQNSTVEHFGLGGHNVVDTLEIRWPSGERQVVTEVSANQRVAITEGAPPQANSDSPDLTREQSTEFWRLYRIATQHRLAGDPNEASRAYDAALAIDPDHEDALYQSGNMYLMMRDFAAAEDAWRRLVRINPLSARAHSQLGGLFLCLDPDAPLDPSAAIVEFDRAHDINKEETGPLLHLGEAALLADDLSSATRHYEAVVASNPRSPTAHFFLGYIAWKQAQPERANAAFGETLRLLHPPGPPSGEVGTREGDTKKGKTPLTATTGCHRLEDNVSQIAEAPQARDGMVGHFKNVEATLTRALRRPPPPPR
jgi:tetratricopeptide (TPR) repeat protein